MVARTLFGSGELPLTTWFPALHLPRATKTNLSPLELNRHLGVCYLRTWRLKHKVMHAMTAEEEDRLLRLDGTQSGFSHDQQTRDANKPYCHRRWR